MKTRLLSSVAIVLALSTTSLLAKGHDQGFGAGLAGPATAGKVDDGQKNSGGMGSATSYGKTDASLEAKAGERDKKEAALAANTAR